MKKLNAIFLAALSAACITGASYAGTSANGPNPTGVEPQSPIGSALGAAQLFAVINADGSTLRGGGNGASTKLGTGIYQVLFRRNISGCGWVGSIGFGAFSGSTAASHISVTGRAGTTTGVFVQTFNTAGSPADLPFNVVVICG